MKKFVVLLAWVIMVIANANAFNVNLLINNKEASSKELTKPLLSEAEEWSRHHHLKDHELRANSIKVLTDTFNQMERVGTNCEIGLVERLKADAQKHQVIVDPADVTKFISYLRQQNLIDDILFKLLRESALIAIDFVKNADKYPARPFNTYTRQNAGFEYEKFYAPVKTWPNDVNKCSLDTYYNMVQKLTWKNGKDRDQQISKLNYIAYTNGTIDLATFNKLETLRVRHVLEWPVYFKRYSDVINNAKDKLTTTPEAETTNNFTIEYVSRKEKITKRVNLYATYDSTQIMMMAQIIERTAKRMDSRRVTLNWQYTDDPNGETEVYIFSPMEQYRAAIRMLRKDMAEVMRSDAFRGTGIQFEHLIAAAYEAGFVKTTELEHVLKFEDFWNPKIPKWKTYSNFAFSLAGSASFYLPPPWNIIGAIGLVLTQSKINGEPGPDPDDNWNVII